MLIILPISTIVFHTRFCLLSSFPRPIFILQVGRFNPMSSLMTKDLGFHCLNYFTKASTFLIIVCWNQPVFTVVMSTLIEHLVIGEHTLVWSMNKNGCDLQNVEIFSQRKHTKVPNFEYLANFGWMEWVRDGEEAYPVVNIFTSSVLLVHRSLVDPQTRNLLIFIELAFPIYLLIPLQSFTFEYTPSWCSW